MTIHPDRSYRMAIKYLQQYKYCPAHYELESMLAQDLLTLMYISLMPLYTTGYMESSFYEAVDNMVGDEVSVFAKKHRNSFTQNKIIENYQLVVEGLSLCLDEIRKHLYIMEWYLNATYPVKSVKGAGVYQTGLAQILFDKMKTYGFEKEWTRMVERAFPPYAKLSSDGETYTLTVQQNFVQVKHELSTASATMRDMSRRNQANRHEIADLKEMADDAKPKLHPKADSRKSKRTRLQNLQVQDSQCESHSEPDTVETESIDEDETDPKEEEENPPSDAVVSNLNVNNLNSYPVQSRKPVTINQATKPKSTPSKGMDWMQQGDKPCFAFIVQGSCHTADCKYSHNPKLRNYTIDKLVKERVTNGGDTATTTLHNLNLYNEVLDRNSSIEEFHQLESFCQSQTETSNDVDE